MRDSLRFNVNQKLKAALLKACERSFDCNKSSRWKGKSNRRRTMESSDWETSECDCRRIVTLLTDFEFQSCQQTGRRQGDTLCCAHSHKHKHKQTYSKRSRRLGHCNNKKQVIQQTLVSSLNTNSRCAIESTMKFDSFLCSLFPHNCMTSTTRNTVDYSALRWLFLRWTMHIQVRYISCTFIQRIILIQNFEVEFSEKNFM